MMAADRGPLKSALAPGTIKMMHGEAAQKVKDGYAEIVYLDEIEYLLGTEEWLELNTSPLAMVPL